MQSRQVYCGFVKCSSSLYAVRTGNINLLFKLFMQSSLTFYSCRDRSLWVHHLINIHWKQIDIRCSFKRKLPSIKWLTVQLFLTSQVNASSTKRCRRHNKPACKHVFTVKGFPLWVTKTQRQNQAVTRQQPRLHFPGINNGRKSLWKLMTAFRPSFDHSDPEFLIQSRSYLTNVVLRDLFNLVLCHKYNLLEVGPKAAISFYKFYQTLPPKLNHWKDFVCCQLEFPKRKQVYSRSHWWKLISFLTVEP